MKIAITFACLLITGTALPCAVPPNSLLESDSALAETSDGIVLARVVGLEPAIWQPRSDRRMAIFHLETTEAIKGNPPATFDLNGFSIDTDLETSGDFNKHLDPDFWARRLANSVMPGDCEAYGRFKVGETYLIFLRKQSHVRAFENVRSQDDLWLRVVRLLVGPRQ